MEKIIYVTENFQPKALVLKTSNTENRYSNFVNKWYSDGKLSKVNGSSTKTVHFISKVGKAKMRLKGGSYF